MLASLEELVLQMGRENQSWGYRRIVGALRDLGNEVSHQTVANVLKSHEVAPAPERKKRTPWREFIRSHTKVLAAVAFLAAGDRIGESSGKICTREPLGGLLKFCYREAA